MMKNINKAILFTLPFAIAISAIAKENVGINNNLGGKLKSTSKGSGVNKVAVGDCNRPANSADLDINNVRAKILTGGDFWWDLSAAKYEIPKGSNRHSLFAGSLWIGGYDQPGAAGNLKVAAMTYRQTGIDFWPGPLNVLQGTIGQSSCDYYDKIFQITRSESDGAELTNNIKNWPGNGRDGSEFNEDPFLAPFRDLNANGKYEPDQGDRPKFYTTEDGNCKNVLGEKRNSYLYGDKALWWVFNDKGNAHGESKSPSGIGLEIRAQAFAFTTDDDINNMTFYQYEIINRSQTDLYNTYFAYWVDPDLGNFNDDVVGCDVPRGLGFVFNSDEDDNGAEGYGKLPAALGIDFFQGPKADAKDGIDNNRNGIIDDYNLVPKPNTPGQFDTIFYEEIIMSRFVYYNNNNDLQNGNPNKLQDFYNYMNGIWRNNTPMYYPENGIGNGTSSANATTTNFMFPGTSDTTIFGKNNYLAWNDGNTSSAAGDRRFLQSAGKFTLESGAVNYITTGVVWAQDPNGSRLGSVDLVKKGDDKAQLIFDNCFKLADGPDAPELTIQELDRKLILIISNKPTSNNAKEGYAEADATLSRPSTYLDYKFDSTFRFQGYKIYQVKRPDVSANELENSAVARLVYEGDLKDNVTTLINYEVDKASGALVGKQRAKGNNNGLVKSLVIEKDLFAESAVNGLVNDKTYYFIAIAYAHNNFKTFKPNVSPVLVLKTVPGVGSVLHDTPNPAFNGQSKPYLQGRKNIKVYIASPFRNAAQFDSTVVKAQYGDGVEISRIQGRGNDGGMLELKDATVDLILANGFSEKLDYKQGKGPLRIKIIDPLNVSKTKYKLEILPGKLNYVLPFKKFTGLSAFSNAGYNYNDVHVFGDSSLFKLTMTDFGSTKDSVMFSDKFLSFDDEFILPSKGISIQIRQNLDPGPNARYSTTTNQDKFLANQNGYIGASITYKDPSKPWFGGIGSFTSNASRNYWIKSSSTKYGGGDNNEAGLKGLDDELVYTKILGGTWGPGALVSVLGRTSVGSSVGFVNYPELVKHLPGIPLNTLSSIFFQGDLDAVTSLKPLLVPTLDKLSNVMVYITKDKTKWTRCPVVNMIDYSWEKTGAKLSNPNQKFSLCRKPSVNKSGLVDASVDTANPENSNFIYKYGMGWFPGYAINTETGERLNMMFGEDTVNVADNGNDMQWNPTSNIFRNLNGNQFYNAWGGRHYVYIFGANAKGVDATPKYQGDFGAKAHKALQKLVYDNASATGANPFSKQHWVGVPGSPLRNEIPALFRDLMWVNVPLLNAGETLLSNDVTININVTKPFGQGFSISNNNNTSLADNEGYPVYEFNTYDIFTDKEKAKSIANALDYVKVVPNPYYAYSAYETSQIDNRVKITNLPEKCEVSIYNASGMLIRKYNKENSDRIPSANNVEVTVRNNYIDWDVKNFSGIPIAGGMYIFYIKDLNTGKEKTIKWLGVLRPTDLDNF